MTNSKRVAFTPQPEGRGFSATNLLIKQYNMGKHLWAKGFFVSTAGYISEDTVKRYIEKQKQQDRIHQWNKAHPKGKQKTIGG